LNWDEVFRSPFLLSTSSSPSFRVPPFFFFSPKEPHLLILRSSMGERNSSPGRPGHSPCTPSRLPFSDFLESEAVNRSVRFFWWAFEVALLCSCRRKWPLPHKVPIFTFASSRSFLTCRLPQLTIFIIKDFSLPVPASHSRGVRYYPFSPALSFLGKSPFHFG